MKSKKKNKRVQTNEVLGTQTEMTILSNPTLAVCSKVNKAVPACYLGTM